VLVGVFHHYGVPSSTGALGLPDGSIQAVIALALILIFALFGVYLHGRAGMTETRRSFCLTSAQLEVIPDGTVVRVTSKRWRRGSLCTEPPPQARVTRAPRNATPRQRRRARQATRRSARQAARNTVVRYNVAIAVANTERQNITTQLLSTVGTLVVAVAGFYFGSKAVQAGVKRGRDAVDGGAQIVLSGGRPNEPPEKGRSAEGVSPLAPGPSDAEDEQDEAAYGEVSPVTRGPSRDEVREELHSAPLAEEDEAEESLREQGADEPPEDELGEEDEDEPVGLEENEEEAATDADTAVAREETLPPRENEEEPPEKV
jgi:hypothetical protein